MGGSGICMVLGR